MAFFTVSVKTDARVKVSRSWVYELETQTRTEAMDAAIRHASQWWMVSTGMITVVDCYAGVRAIPVPLVFH